MVRDDAEQCRFSIPWVPGNNGFWWLKADQGCDFQFAWRGERATVRKQKRVLGGTLMLAELCKDACNDVRCAALSPEML